MKTRYLLGLGVIGIAAVIAVSAYFISGVSLKESSQQINREFLELMANRHHELFAKYDSKNIRVTADPDTVRKQLQLLEEMGLTPYDLDKFQSAWQHREYADGCVVNDATATYCGPRLPPSNQGPNPYPPIQSVIGVINPPIRDFPTIPASGDVAPLTPADDDPSSVADVVFRSSSDLRARFADADAPERSAIINELERRAQAATTIIAEFHENMQFQLPHNVRVVVARGKDGEVSVQPSEQAISFLGATVEPEVIRETETETTMDVGVGLSGAGLTFEPQGMLWAIIPDGTEKTFSWIVTPQREGNLQMTIDVLNRIKIGDQEMDLQVRNFPEVITVSTDTWTKIGRFFTGVDTAVNTAKNIGIAIVTLLGFSSIGAAYAGIRAWAGRSNRSTGS